MKEEMPCFCKMIIPNPTIVHSSMCLWKLEKDEKKKKPTVVSPVEVKIDQNENYKVGDFIRITGFHSSHPKDIEIEWVGHGHVTLNQS